MRKLVNFFGRTGDIIIAFFSWLFGLIFRRNRGQEVKSYNRAPQRRAPQRRGGESLGRSLQSNNRKKVAARTSNYFALLIFPAAITYYEILMRIWGQEEFFYNIITVILFALGLGLILTALSVAFSKKVNRIFTIAALGIIAIHFIIQVLSFDTFQTYFSIFAVFERTGSVLKDYRTELIDSIIGGIPKIILYLAPTVLYIIFGKKVTPPLRFHKNVIIGLLIIGTVFNIFGGIGVSVSGTRELYTNEYEYTAATNTFGLVTSTRLEFRNAIFGTSDSGGGFEPVPPPVVNPSSEVSSDVSSIVSSDISSSISSEIEPPKVFGYNKMDIDFAALANSTSNSKIKELHQYVASLTPSKQNKYTGLFEGKNLIMICAESYDNSFIDPEITPTLYRLTHNGIYMSNFYQPAWGGSTVTGEFSFMFGITPPASNSVFLSYTVGKNNYFTMGNQFQRKGWTSLAFHNGSHTFYDRNKTHVNLGFDKYLAGGSGLEEATGKSYPSDQETINAIFNTYYEDSTKPFYYYFLTVSGHPKYKEDDWRVKKYYDQLKAHYGNKYKKKTLVYISYQMVLEDALTDLVNILEEKGIANDTVIAVCPDHFPYGLSKSETWNNDQNYINDLKGMDTTKVWNRDSNGAIIWSGCLENEYKDYAVEISDPTMSLDLLPTLTNLFGFEFDSRLLTGRDMLAEDTQPLAYWQNNTWVTERGIYDAKNKKFYPNEGYEDTDDEYIKTITSIVKNKITFSKGILNNDYYGVLFGKDPS